MKSESSWGRGRHGKDALNVYDARGNVVISWAEGVCDDTYTPSGYTLNRASRAWYDALGRKTQSFSPDSKNAVGEERFTTYTYNDDGLLLRTTNPDYSWVENTAYDKCGRVTDTQFSTGDGTSATTSATYDPAGRLMTATNANGFETEFTYDHLGRQTAAGYAGFTAESQFTYNTLGWNLATQDADGFATTYLYDKVGRVLSETTADYVTVAEYNTAGQLLTQAKYPMGQSSTPERRTNFTYDVFGRAINEEQLLHPGQPEEETVRDLTNQYDSLSRVTLSDDDGLDLHHRFTYPVNTTSGTTDTAFIGPESSDSATVVITVDAHGLETSRALDIDPLDPYQPVAEIIRTIDPEDGRDDARRVTAAYLDHDALTQTPDLLQAAYDYDQAGHLIAQGGVGFTAAGATYEYDVSETETTWASGLKIEEHLNLTLVGSAGAISATYTYDEDSENRLESATMDIDGDDTDDITDTYDFDQAGNLQSVIGAGGTWSYLYGYEADPASDSNRLVRIDKDGAPQMHFTFDPEDRWRTMQAPTSAQDDPDRELFTYTEAGRLATYQRYEGGTLALTATYTYDPAGQRKRSVVTEGTGEDEVITTTEYTYVGLSLQELRATQDGAQTASWTITYLHDEAGRPYGGIYRDSETQGPQFFLLVTTDRGDVVSLTDKNGNPFAAYRYDPWGDPVGEVSPPPLVRHEEDDTALTYQGTWTTTQDQEASAGSLTSTDETGASVTYEFTGTGVDWITTTSAIQGIASVTLDGGTPELIDLHSESTVYQQSAWTSDALEAGTHTLVIAWTGTKNENSSGTTIGVDALDVTGVPEAGHRPPGSGRSRPWMPRARRSSAPSWRRRSAGARCCATPGTATTKKARCTTCPRGTTTPRRGCSSPRTLPVTTGSRARISTVWGTRWGWWIQRGTYLSGRPAVARRMQR